MDEYDGASTKVRGGALAIFLLFRFDSLLRPGLQTREAEVAVRQAGHHSVQFECLGVSAFGSDNLDRPTAAQAGTLRKALQL